MTTALIRYQDRWAVEDPVLDWVIYQHDKKEYEEMNERLDDDNVIRAYGSVGSTEESREEKAARYIKESGKTQHTSDCATSLAPAEEPGPCDCDMPNDEVCKYPPGCTCEHHAQSTGPCQAESLIWAAVCDTLPAESVKALSQRVIELREAKTWLPIGAFSWCGGFTKAEQPAAPEAGNDQGVPPQPKCKNCGKFKAMHQGWRWCGIPAKPNSFFQPDDEPEPHPVSAEPETQKKRTEVQAEIELVRSWFEGHSDSSVIEELAARSVEARAENARLEKEIAGLREALEKALRTGAFERETGKELRAALVNVTKLTETKKGD